MRFLSFVLLFLFLGPVNATAALLVSPTRVVFDGNTREQSVVLHNHGSETEVYRLSFENLRALPKGGYETITSVTSATGELFAEKMLRFTPRQVRLEPGQRQIVKLQLRRPPGLPAGEYRSHLKFTEVPDTTQVRPPDPAVDQRRVSFGIRVNYSVSIPVIVRQGRLLAQAAIEDIRLEPVAGKPYVYRVEVDVTRTGNQSLYGDLVFKFRPERAREETQVGSLRGVAVLTPNRSRTASTTFEVPSGTSKGRLSIEYIDRDANRGTIARGNVDI